VTLKKNNPGCDCCGESGVPCEHCQTGKTPAIVPLEIIGFGDGGLCNDCAGQLNGTHLLPKGEDEFGAKYACLWRSYKTICHNEDPDILTQAITLISGAGDVDKQRWYASVTDGLGFVQVEYESGDVDSPADCEAYRELSLSYHFGGIGCTFNESATWYVNNT